MAEQRPNRQRLAFLSELLANRGVCGWLAAAGALHVGLVGMGLGGWPCPIKSGTGLRCPGCGMGHAGVLLLQGKWEAALHAHPFGPVFLVGVAFIGLAAVLPERIRVPWISRLNAFEQRFPLPAALLVAAFIFGVARMVLDALAATQ